VSLGHPLYPRRTLKALGLWLRPGRKMQAEVLQSLRMAQKLRMDGSAAWRCGTYKTVMVGKAERCLWAATWSSTRSSTLSGGDSLLARLGGPKKITIFTDAHAALERIGNDDPDPGQWLARRILRTERQLPAAGCGVPSSAGSQDMKGSRGTKLQTSGLRNVLENWGLNGSPARNEPHYACPCCTRDHRDQVERTPGLG
jgi:hypothetical protein